MPLDLQLGDVANRIRRAFGVRGRIPTKLDEMIVPVAVISQLDQDPYRLEPITWSGAFVGLGNPPAGEAWVLGVRCVSGVVVVDATYLVANVAIFLNRRQTQNFATVPDVFFALNQQGSGAGAARPAAVAVADTIALPLAGNAVRIWEGTMQGLLGSDPVFGNHARPVLYAGDELLLQMPVDTPAPTTDLIGREFPVLP